MNIHQVITDRAVEMYKSGASRMEVARYFMQEKKIGNTAGKDWARKVWDENFDTEYVPMTGKYTKKKKTSDSFEGLSTFPDDEEVAVVATKALGGVTDYSVKGNGFIPSIEELYVAINMDPTEWQIFDMQCGTYQVARKNKSSDLKIEGGKFTGEIKDKGGMYVQPLYSLKFKVKRILPMPVKELITTFKEEVGGIAPAAIVRPTVSDNGRLMVISLVDHHLGKITYDNSFKDICDNYRNAFGYFLGVAEEQKAERILMITGHDFFNIDNIANTTTSGTPQDNNVAWKTLFKRGCSLNVECLESALKKFPVDVMNVPGNHDEQTAFAMGEYLGAWFRNTSHFNINNKSDEIRKYYKWGKCLLGSTHCRYEKVKDLPLKMAVESPHFSECDFRHFFLGHIHTQKMLEDHGVIAEYLPTLSSMKDEYHITRGYVGNQKCSKAFIFDKDHGQLQNYYFRNGMVK